MKRSLYFCAPWGCASMIAPWVTIARAEGFEVTCSWVEAALQLGTHDPLNREAIQANDEQLYAADAVVVLALDGQGGEMFCEFTRALMAGKQVFWVGRKILSTYRPGVTICDNIGDAIETAKAVLR